jgi:hypothetical protein
LLCGLHGLLGVLRGLLCGLHGWVLLRDCRLCEYQNGDEAGDDSGMEMLH